MHRRGLMLRAASETGPVKISMRWPRDGESRNFDRPREQLLEKTLMRMSLTLQKGLGPQHADHFLLKITNF